MDKQFLIKGIEITLGVKSDEFSKPIEEIISDFKKFLPDFKSDSTNVLIMKNKEERRRLIFFLNRFNLSLDFTNHEDQLDFISNAIQFVNSYTLQEELECSFEFSFFAKQQNNSFSNIISYPSSSNDISKVILDTLGFTITYNDEEYDIWVQEGQLVDKNTSINLRGFFITVNHDKVIGISSEWSSNWNKIINELPQEIVSFLAKTLI